MFFYIVPFIFLTTLCFGMERNFVSTILEQLKQIEAIEQRCDIWKQQFKTAIEDADCLALNYLVDLPHFSSQHMIKTSELGSLLYLNPISYIMLFCKKNRRVDLLHCIDILHKNKVEILVPKEGDSLSIVSPFAQVKSRDEFNHLLKLCYGEKEDVENIKKIGKEILEVEGAHGTPVFFTLMQKINGAQTIIDLYKEYKPDVLGNENILIAPCVGFINGCVTIEGVKKGQIKTGYLDVVEADYYDYIKKVIPFLIAQGAEIFKTNSFGYSLDDIREFIFYGYKAQEIITTDSLRYLVLSIVQNASLIRQNNDYDGVLLLKQLERDIPSEEELVARSVNLVLKVNPEQKSSLRDVIIDKRKNPSNSLHGLIARQYKI